MKEEEEGIKPLLFFYLTYVKFDRLDLETVRDIHY